jgi:hypothetical protein
MSIMTKEMINGIKEQINNRFNNMTIDEFDNLACGDGTLYVLDEILETMDIEYDEAAMDELAEHCCRKSDEFCNKHFVSVLGYTLSTKQVLTDITDMSKLIHNVLIDMDSIGRLKAYVDLYSECANKYFDDHYVERLNIKYTLQELVQTLQDTRELTDDDMSDLFNDYLNEFDEKIERVLEDYKAHSDYDYNDTDNFIDYLNEYNDLDQLEAQLIATIYYSTVNERDQIIGYKCFRLNGQTGELLDEQDYHHCCRRTAINAFCLEYDCAKDNVIIYPITKADEQSN